MNNRQQELEESIANDALRRACLEYRAKHNLTQRQLAQLCRLSRDVIIKVESAQHTSQISQIKVYRIVQDGFLKP